MTELAGDGWALVYEIDIRRLDIRLGRTGRRARGIGSSPAVPPVTQVIRPQSMAVDQDGLRLRSDRLRSPYPGRLDPMAGPADLETRSRWSERGRRAFGDDSTGLAAVSTKVADGPYRGRSDPEGTSTAKRNPSAG